jgi:hypothetical protein
MTSDIVMVRTVSSSSSSPPAHLKKTVPERPEGSRGLREEKVKVHNLGNDIKTEPEGRDDSEDCPVLATWNVLYSQ